jgi:hypothetical protein
MPALWQDVLAGLVALAALGWLVRRRLRARGAACEGCEGGCALDAPAPSPAPRGQRLVTIEGLDHRDGR